MNYSNLFRNVFFIALTLFAVSFTANKIKDAFPDAQKKGAFFTCNDKIYTEIKSSLRIKEYLTSADGLTWQKENSISCTNRDNKSAFEHSVAGGYFQNIINTAAERVDIQHIFTTNRKKYHAVRRLAVGTNVAHNIVLAFIEGTGDNRKMNYITPTDWGYQLKGVYVHPQNPRKIVTVAYKGNNTMEIIMGILAIDGKSFSFKQRMTLSKQSYTKIAFFNDKLYVMGDDKLFSLNMASATDNTKFLNTTETVSISQHAQVLVNSGYDVNGKFLVTTGANPHLFIHHNHQTSGAKYLDVVDKSGNLRKNILERATVKTGKRTSLGGRRD